MKVFCSGSNTFVLTEEVGSEEEEEEEEEESSEEGEEEEAEGEEEKNEEVKRRHRHRRPKPDTPSGCHCISASRELRAAQKREAAEEAQRFTAVTNFAVQPGEAAAQAMSMDACATQLRRIQEYLMGSPFVLFGYYRTSLYVSVILGF